MNEEGMTANPLYDIEFFHEEMDTIEADEIGANEIGANEIGANTIIEENNEKKDRPKLNRKSKNEINEEFYNNSKEALQDLDNYLFGFY
jgi:hypothetical protein